MINCIKSFVPHYNPGEQLVPQTPLSSSYDYHGHRGDTGHTTSTTPRTETHRGVEGDASSTTSTTPIRATHTRERRRLPDSPMEGVQQQHSQTTASQLDLFRGDDIFG